MEILFVLLFGFLIFWVIHVILKKIGIYESFFNRKFMNTRFSKSIVFILKVYSVPLKGVSLKSGENSFLGTRYFLISTSYLISLTIFISGSFFFADSSHMIEQINKGKYETIEGEVTEIYRSAYRTQYYLTIRGLGNREKKIRYFFINGVEDSIQGKVVKVLYVKTFSDDNQLVALSDKSGMIRTLEEDVDWRVRENHKWLKMITISFFLSIVLPWIRFWQFGLIPFYFWVKR